jgi:hypothetical protein
LKKDAFLCWGQKTTFILWMILLFSEKGLKRGLSVLQKGFQQKLLLRTNTHHFDNPILSIKMKRSLQLNQMMRTEQKTTKKKNETTKKKNRKKPWHNSSSSGGAPRTSVCRTRGGGVDGASHQRRQVARTLFNTTAQLRKRTNKLRTFQLTRTANV